MIVDYLESFLIGATLAFLRGPLEWDSEQHRAASVFYMSAWEYRARSWTN